MSLVAAGMLCLAGQAALASAEPVTLRWFLRWDQVRIDKVAKPVKAAFEAAHPNIKIEIENIGSGQEYWLKLQTTAAAGSAPDVVYPATHNAYMLAAKGQLLDLTPLIKRDKVDLTAYIQPVLDLYKYRDSIHGLPVDTAAVVVFYNKDMFKASGVANPKDGMTWNEFLEVSKTLVKDKDGDGKIDQYALHWDPVIYWQMVLTHFTGKDTFDDLHNPTRFLLNEAKAVDALQFCADLMTKYRVAPAPSQRADITDMFLAGNAATNVIGHWRVPTYNASAKFDWDVVAVPRGEFAANRGDGSCFAISKNTKHPEEAWEFVKYLVAPGAEGVKLLLGLGQMVPALRDLCDSELFLKTPGQKLINKKAFLAYRDNLMSCYQPFHPIFAEIDNVIRQEFGNLWEGKETAREAVKKVTPRIEALLREASL